MTRREIDEKLKGIFRYGSVTDKEIFVSTDVEAVLLSSGDLKEGHLHGVYGVVVPVEAVPHWPDGTIVGWDWALERPDLP